MSSVEADVKKFILEEFLPGEDPDELAMDTPMVSSGILDSLATLKLISFLESTYKVQIAPHEADEEHLNTIQDIAKLVAGKL